MSAREKCPKCNEPLIYEDVIDECYTDETHSMLWQMKCPKCDFEGKLWETYRIESWEWEKE